tara:strand:- start:523 stop:747 length:225 start_codon:yes stop_codon:yes gene_type:complete
MQIFSKKFFINLLLLTSLFSLSACEKSGTQNTFSFYKTFINPDYIELGIEDYSSDLKASDEKIDLESVPESVLE